MFPVTTEMRQDSECWDDYYPALPKSIAPDGRVLVVEATRGWNTLLELDVLCGTAS